MLTRSGGEKHGKSESSHRDIKHFVTWWSHPDSLLFPWCGRALWSAQHGDSSSGSSKTRKHTTTGKGKNRWWQDILRNKESVRETGNKAIEESSKMAPPLDVTVGSTNTSCFVITEDYTGGSEGVPLPQCGEKTNLPLYKEMHNGWVSPPPLFSLGSLRITQTQAGPNTHTASTTRKTTRASTQAELCA